MKKFTLALLTFVMVFSFAGVAIVGAQNFVPETLPTNITTQTDLLRVVTTIVNWIFTIFIVISVIFIMIAAFDFVTGGDDPEKISKARQRIIWAIAGIAVALLARAIPTVLKTIIV